jgi:predicted small metal-binding protein
MFADEALRCDCGYEVRASDEAARVDEVRRHASETHGIDLSGDIALDVVRRVRLVPSNEQRGARAPLRLAASGVARLNGPETGRIDHLPRQRQTKRRKGKP